MPSGRSLLRSSEPSDRERALLAVVLRDRASAPMNGSVVVMSWVPVKGTVFQRQGASRHRAVEVHVAPVISVAPVMSQRQAA